jgi:hypothetical protein
MIKHVVMFKAPGDLDKTKKKELLNRLKEKLNELPKLIPAIKEYEIGTNFIDSPRAYDIVLISSFENTNELDDYRVHPDHKKVVEFITLNSFSTVAVDYEYE